MNNKFLSIYLRDLQPKKRSTRRIKFIDKYIVIFMVASIVLLLTKIGGEALAVYLLGGNQ